MPCAYNHGDCFTFTKQSIEHIGKHVDIYGIGILSNAVRRLYPNYAILQDVTELEKTLLEVVKQKIID